MRRAASVGRRRLVGAAEPRSSGRYVVSGFSRTRQVRLKADATYCLARTTRGPWALV